MYTNKLLGKEVLDVNGNKIGTVADIDVDLIKGTIDHLLVKSGLLKKYTISLDSIDKVGDRLILKIRTDELE